MRLKNNKAPGIDGLPSEIWKYGGGALQSRLYEVLRRIWDSEQQPQEWNMAIICPIHKKGCKKKCTNYRGIALLPTAYKVLSYVLQKRLEVYARKISPSSAGASPGGGSVSPATGGLSPASGSPVGATVPLPVHATEHNLYDTQNHLSVPNTNNYLHHSKNMSPLDHGWLASSYQSHCSPPSQYSSASNINLPSPTMAHSPGSPVGESSQTDYNNLHTVLLQPFEQITMLDPPTSNYNTTYVNHSSPHSPQTTNSQHTYSRATGAQPPGSMHMAHGSLTHSQSHSHPHPHQQHQHQHQQHQHAHQHPHQHEETRRARDPVAGGGYPLQPLASPSQPATPASIPDIILTDYSGELDAGIFGGEEAQLRAGLDLDDLTLLEEPSALLPDSAVEHEFRLDRLDRL
ncbi:unnamed protein product [Colias eurytheme]|nr:unnamed protein product [Colias eurytheme]